MEFRCRVATASGQVMEATYVAESEARLRHELEEKGLFLLSVQGGGASRSGSSGSGCRSAGKIPTPSSWSSTRSWPRCSRPACRSCSRSTSCAGASPNPMFKAALDDIYDKVRSGTALSEAFEAQHLFSGVYTASLMAGEKSGSLEQVLRRYVAAHQGAARRPVAASISALIYPVVLVVLSIGRRRPDRLQGRAASSRSSTRSSATARELPLSTRIVVAISTHADRQRGRHLLAALAALIVGGDAAGSGSRSSASGCTRRSCGCRISARWRASSRPRRSRARWRRCSPAAFRSSTRSTSPRSRSATWPIADEPGGRGRQVREGGSLGDRARRAAHVSARRRRNGGSRRVDRRAGGHAEQRRRLLRRGERDEPDALLEPDSAGAADRDGRRHRGSAAVAVHAALQAVVADEAEPWPNPPPPPTDTLYAEPEAPPIDHAAEEVRGAAAGRALPARVRRSRALPHRPRAVPEHPGRPDAALRLRAVPPRRPDAR